MYARLCNPLKSRSFFIFGPRGVGKTWLLRAIFADQAERVVTISLLKEEPYLELLGDPARLRRYLNPASSKEVQWIIIDEVQRVPAILSEVHDILEDPIFNNKVRFALTGSSARKLKRGGADLLAGRALVNNLYPLSFLETNDQWSLEQALNWGCLPAVVDAEDDTLRAEILRAYVGTYIKEEIKEEQIVRKLEPFIRFLEAAAQANGELVTYSNLARKSMVDEKAVSRYFEILEDTLIGFFLPPYTKSARERALAQSKFYFFDVGVKRALERNLGVKSRPSDSNWGRAFEHYIIMECVCLNSYFKRDAKLSQLKTKDGAEIDLIIEFPRKKPLCIEIKSSKNIPTVEINKLLKISQAIPGGIPIIVYDGEHEQHENGVRIIPWKKFFNEIW